MSGSDAISGVAIPNNFFASQKGRWHLSETDTIAKDEKKKLATAVSVATEVRDTTKQHSLADRKQPKPARNLTLLRGGLALRLLPSNPTPREPFPGLNGADDAVPKSRPPPPAGLGLGENAPRSRFAA